MHEFKDNTGRTWSLDLNFDVIERVLEREKIDLLAPHEGKPPLLVQLDLDLRLLYHVLRSALLPQREERKLSEADFARAIGGKASVDAHDALFEELRDFFQHTRREDLVTAVATELDLTRKAIQAGKLNMQAEAAKLTLKIENPDAGSGPTSGSSPESSASTPDA